jgi:type IV pilus assembly protein PilA
MKVRQAGFSLIELLIVVAIILIIAAIAIPSFMRARMAANESSAGSSMRSINTAEVSYAATYPTVGFAPLSALGPDTSPCNPSSTNGCFIDSYLAQSASVPPGKDGYIFNVTIGAPPDSYVSNANALTINQTGTRSYCSDQSGVIYFKSGANNCSPSADVPLQ